MPPSRAPVSPAVSRFAAMALLFGVTLLLFSRSIGFGFVNYDDPRYVIHNAHVHAPFGWDTIVWAFTARAELWQPLTWFSHVLDWHLYGDNPGGHHLTSVLWHAINAALAFGVFRRLTGSFGWSVLAAAAFAWHPLRVESVTWVTERKDVMSGCFFLLTVWSYLGYAEARARAQPARNRYVATLLLFAAGLMCKPTLVTLPLLFFAFDFWPARRLSLASVAPAAGHVPLTGRDVGPPETGRSLVREKLPFLTLSLGIGLVTLHLQKDYGAFRLDLPFTARLANVPVALVRYLGKFAWPADLSVCYPHPGWWPAGRVVGAAFIVAALTAAAWHWRRPAPWLVVGWAWFIALLLPTIGLVQVGFQSLADRYSYLPLLGIVLAVVGTAQTLGGNRRPRAVLVVLALLLLGGAAVRTWQQQAVWRDSLTLFRHAVAASGSSSVSEGFLGYTLASLGRAEEAAIHCERALALDPKNEMAAYALARVRADQGRLDEALAAFRRSVALNPKDTTTNYEFAIELLAHGDTAEAATRLAAVGAERPDLILENHRLADRDAALNRPAPAALRYVAATMLEPMSARAHFEAGAALMRLGRNAAARASLLRAVELAPDLVPARVELGLLELTGRNPAGAATHFRAALAQQPHLAAANVGLGRAEEALGHVSEADACFERALAAAPDDAEVARAWADILARRGRFSDAAAQYRRAATLRPGDAAAHAGLGYALWLSGRRDEAVGAWREALRLDPRFPGLRERLQQLGR